MDKQRPLVVCMAGIVLAGALVLLLAGCGSPPGGESEIPWNAPQPWEGSPFIPGLSQDY